MTGLQKFFIRITPIIMLICFICFGISHIFTTNNQQNITYLTHETIQINENTTIEDYTYDFQGYIQNANASRLKDSVTTSMEIESWQSLINSFDTIWGNGYDPADITLTLLNGILLIVDGFITAINLLILPIKLSAGIILTALTIMGIKTNNVGIITTTLNGIIDYVTIPLIPPALPSGTPLYYNTVWYLGDNVRITNPYTDVFVADLNITTNGGGIYKRIALYNRGNNICEVIYTDTSNAEITVFRTGAGWYYNDSRTITISQNNDFTDIEQYIGNLLTNLDATQIN